MKETKKQKSEKQEENQETKYQGNRDSGSYEQLNGNYQEKKTSKIKDLKSVHQIQQ